MRLFAALDLSDIQRREIHTLQQRLRFYLDGVKWTNPVEMHLTLKFLGEVEPDRIPGILEAIELAAAAAAPFPLAFGGCGAFPSLQKARVLWVGLRQGCAALTDLAAKLEATLADQGFPPESRPFTPHLTLGRLRYPLPLKMIHKFNAEEEHFLTSIALADGVTLYQSLLSRQGASYKTLQKKGLRRNLNENAGN